jgi:hypothetical protein
LVPRSHGHDKYRKDDDHQAFEKMLLPAQTPIGLLHKLCTLLGCQAGLLRLQSSPFLLFRFRPPLLLGVPSIPLLPDRPGEKVVGQLDARGAVALFEAEKAAVDQEVQLALREAGRDRIVLGHAVAEPLRADEFLLDELTDPGRQALPQDR